MIRFALIGCGRIAQRHAEQISRVGRLVATCDVFFSKAQALAAASGATAYASIDDLLAEQTELDVVVVCTPNGLHAEHAIKAIQARHHVLCEKPLCLSSAAAYTMRDNAHFFRRHLFVVKQNRFNPPVQAVRRMIDEGRLGRVLSFSVQGYWDRPGAYYTGDWRGSLHLDGGMVYTQFSHFIDLVLWLLGDVAHVQAQTKNFGLRQHLQTEDTMTALLQMERGALGTLHFSINAQGGNKEGSLTIIGEKASVKIGGQYLNTLEWLTDSEVSQSQAGANNYGFYTGSMSNHHLVYDELVKALDGKPHQLPDPAEAIKTVALIEKLYGREIPVFQA